MGATCSDTSRTYFADISKNVSINPKDPTGVWNNHLSLHSRYGKCETANSTAVHDGSTPKTPGHIRFVCISDTHGQHRKMTIPNGDVLLHAGDITNVGEPAQFEDFVKWLSELPHPEKIVIAGNHDLTIQTEFYIEEQNWCKWAHCNSKNHGHGQYQPQNSKRARHALCESSKDILTYLEDAAVSVAGGYKVYGSPWQPEFLNWAFNLPRGEPCAKMWEKIPDDVDILLTHGPPVGHGDLCSNGQRAGCVDLLAAIADRAKPLLHVFGHIHEGYGATTNGITTFINASSCTLQYKATQGALVFDLPRKR